MSSPNLNTESGYVVRSFPSLSNLQGKGEVVNILRNAKGVNMFDRYNRALEYL